MHQAQTGTITGSHYLILFEISLLIDFLHCKWFQAIKIHKKENTEVHKNYLAYLLEDTFLT